MECPGFLSEVKNYLVLLLENELALNILKGYLKVLKRCSGLLLVSESALDVSENEMELPSLEHSKEQVLLENDLASEMAPPMEC